eukprot:15341212-Ditylum_brightwellii.AAC.1
MLNAFAATCAEFFGDELLGVVKLRKMLDFVNENKNTFKEWQCNDSTFMSKWLYVINCGWQQFTVKAKEGKIDLSTMCFRRCWEDFECRVFRVRLHQVLTRLIGSRRKRPGDGTGGETKEIYGHQFKRKRGDTIKNTKPNPAWLIKENKNYGGLLHNGMYMGKVKLPMWDNKRQSCAK